MPVFVGPLTHRYRPHLDAITQCLMVADTLDELAKFAVLIRCTNKRFNAVRRMGTHYLLTPWMRKRALMNGAVEVDEWKVVAIGEKS